jgi:hypothetical protein
VCNAPPNTCPDYYTEDGDDCDSEYNEYADDYEYDDDDCDDCDCEYDYADGDE